MARPGQTEVINRPSAVLTRPNRIASHLAGRSHPSDHPLLASPIKGEGFRTRHKDTPARRPALPDASAPLATTTSPMTNSPSRPVHASRSLRLAEGEGF